MPHPKSKTELLAATTAQRDALAAMLAGLSRDQMLWPGEYGWSAKDHVAHLAEWERLLLGWYDAGRRGESPAVPAEGFTWATMDALNQRIFEQYRDAPLEWVVADWQATSGRLLALAQAVPEAELFGPGRFAWTGRGTLASFVFECGANHYRWSAGQIKRGLKARH